MVEKNDVEKLKETESPEVPKTPTPLERWENIVENSNGGSMFLPDQFLKKAEELKVKRDAFNKMLQKVAKEEITLATEMQSLWLDLREYLEENGREDIWMKDIGFDSNALKDDIHIVNISDKRG